MPGLPSLGEKQWAHPLPLATIPPGAWHRYTPPCLCAPWHPSHGLICHSLTLAPSTGLAHGRQLSGPGQHLSPLPFSHINCVLSIVRDINKPDLRQAYHQMEVMEESEKYLTINMHKGLFQYSWLFFGVTSCPAIWQCAMARFCREYLTPSVSSTTWSSPTKQTKSIWRI